MPERQSLLGHPTTFIHTTNPTDLRREGAVQLLRGQVVQQPVQQRHHQRLRRLLLLIPLPLTLLLCLVLLALVLALVLAVAPVPQPRQGVEDQADVLFLGLLMVVGG